MNTTDAFGGLLLSPVVPVDNSRAHPSSFRAPSARRARTTNPPPRVRVLPTQGGVQVALGSLRLPIDDAACSPESLWAWMAAVDVGCLPAALLVRDARPGASQCVIWTADSITPQGIHMTLAVVRSSPWSLKPEPSLPGITDRDFCAPLPWWQGLRRRLAQAWQGTSRPHLCRPADLLQWAEPPPASKELAASALFESAFWWQLSLWFAPPQWPRMALRSPMACHRVAHRWAQHSLWAALTGWAIMARVRLDDVGQISMRGRGNAASDPYASAHPHLLGRVEAALSQWQSGLSDERLPSIDHKLVELQPRRLHALMLLQDWHSRVFESLCRLGGPPLAAPTRCPLPYALGDWVQHPSWGRGRVRAMDVYQEPVSVRVGFAASGERTVSAADLSPCTYPLAPWVEHAAMGSGTTGLQGPFAPLGKHMVRPPHLPVPSRGSRHLPERSPHLGQALYIQAAPVPVKRLRGLLSAIARGFQQRGWVPTLSVRGGLNLALPLTADTVPEARLREVGQRLQEAFVRRYTELQRRAVFSGRYFPPPLALHVGAQADGAVRVAARFAPGYVLHGDEVAVQYPSEPKRHQRVAAPVPSPVAAPVPAEPVPRAPRVQPPMPVPAHVPAPDPVPAPAQAPKPSSVELPLNLAQQLAPAQTALLLCDFVAGYGYYQGDSVIDHMRPGDPLTLRPEPGNPHDALAVAIEWRVCKLGYVPRPLNQVVARLLTMGQPLQARTVAAPHSVVPWRRVAFAIYLAMGHRNEQSDTSSRDEPGQPDGPQPLPLRLPGAMHSCPPPAS